MVTGGRGSDATGALLGEEEGGQVEQLPSLDTRLTDFIQSEIMGGRKSQNRL